MTQLKLILFNYSLFSLLCQLVNCWVGREDWINAPFGINSHFNCLDLKIWRNFMCGTPFDFYKKCSAVVFNVEYHVWLNFWPPLRRGGRAEHWYGRCSKIKWSEPGRGSGDFFTFLSLTFYVSDSMDDLGVHSSYLGAIMGSQVVLVAWKELRFRTYESNW